MKKLFLLIMVMVMSFTLIACGGDTDVSSDSVSLVEVTTEQGVSLVLPSDMPFQTIQGNRLYVNAETGDSAGFAITDISNSPLSEVTEEYMLALYQSQYEGVEVKSFENGIEINGKESLVAMIEVTTPEGNEVTLVLVMISDGNSGYVVNFIYGKDNADSSLAQNIQTCIDSIKI